MTAPGAAENVRECELFAEIEKDWVNTSSWKTFGDVHAILNVAKYWDGILDQVL